MNTTKNTYYFSNFYEFYKNSIGSKLCEIDIFIKTSDTLISSSDVAKLLYISHLELDNIMTLKNIDLINSTNFFEIMESGSSYICKLFAREKECGSPYIYTREQISYIYELDIDTINEVCDKLNIIKITNYSLPLVFSQISFKGF